MLRVSLYVYDRDHSSCARTLASSARRCLCGVASVIRKRHHMKLLPDSKQWARWSLPSKYTTIALLVGIVSTILTITFYYYPRTDADSLKLIESQRQLLKRLGAKTRENDLYGLTAFRIGTIHEELKEGNRFLEKLKWYRKAMLEGDKNARRKVIAAYEELLRALARDPNEVVNMFLALDKDSNLLFFEFNTVPIEKLTVGSKNPFSLKYTVPHISGQLRLIFCVDVLDLVNEEDEGNNCKEHKFDVISSQD